MSARRHQRGGARECLGNSPGGERLADAEDEPADSSDWDGAAGWSNVVGRNEVTGCHGRFH